MNVNKYNEVVTKGIDKTASNVVKYMTGRGLKLAAAESCTGGLISAVVTSVPGASAVFAGGAVTYSPEMKIAMIGVKPETIEKHTVYSHETAREMADGIRRVTGADFAAAVTGIAGPDGGTEEKPVGTVYAAVSFDGGCFSKDLRIYDEKEYGEFCKDREGIRKLTVLRTLEWLAELMTKDKDRDGECNVDD